MPQQPAKPGIRALEALGLTVFLATAAFLTALFLARLGSVFDSLQTTAAAFSTLCAAVAAFAMLIDAADLWVRGRGMAPRTVKSSASLVFVAILGARGRQPVGRQLTRHPLPVAGDDPVPVHRAEAPRSALRRGRRRLARLRRWAHGDCRSHQVPAAQGRQEAPLRRRPAATPA